MQNTNKNKTKQIFSSAEFKKKKKTRATYTVCHSQIVAARDDDGSSSGSSFLFSFPCLLDVSVKNPQSTANQSASFLLPAVYDLHQRKC
jgi:hypothetical protein